MSVIGTGRISELILFLAVLITTIYCLRLGLKGRRFELRSLPPVEAISDIVDRGVEEGKPIYVTPGDVTNLKGRESVWTIAGLNVVRYTISLCVKKGARPILIPSNQELIPIMDGIYREVCVAAGRPEAYNRENVLYRGEYQLATIEHMAREGVSGLISIGGLSGGTHVPVVAFARDLGGLVVAGTPRFLHQGTFTLLADFPVFMDDVYAAGAICSGDEVVKSTLIASDIIKSALIAVTIISIVGVVLGMPFHIWLSM